MSNPIGIFAPQYYGSVYYFAAMYRCAEVVVDMGLRYNKRFKSVHRTEIADTRGRLTLTVPVSVPKGAPVGTWDRVEVSSHGAWWHDHLVSLESAYGRTPFFEFYIDRFMPWLRDINIPVTEMDRGITEVLFRALQIPARLTFTTDINAYADNEADIIDYRSNNFSDIKDVGYYQVRADRLGFLPDLSALDLLFNMGPEAPLILHATQKTQ